ncbi:MAG TPA: class D sortase [Anaerolineaceae bacterium]
MTKQRRPEDLSVEELRRLLIEKRRATRQTRLDYFRQTGRIIPVNGQGLPEPAAQAAAPRARSRGRVWLDRLLFVVEIAAVIGLVVVLLSGMNVLTNLNNEFASVLTQPTLTPTPIIMAVVLPSGHTPPTGGEVRYNEAEIPDHLRPLMQSLADLPLPTPSPEQAIQIQIPAIKVDAPVVQGDGFEQLKKGVGQHIGTPNPGTQGNVVLSAHNDVFGRIFMDLDKLKEGDAIILYTNARAYTYIVRQTQIVEPTQVEVMAPTQESVVTLISCYPYMVDNQRIVVTGYLQ